MLAHELLKSCQLTVQIMELMPIKPAPKSIQIMFDDGSVVADDGPAEVDALRIHGQIMAKITTNA